MNITAGNISCIILAGGQGARFNNQDKGLIKLDGAPFVEHVINCVSNQVDDIVISANRNRQAYSEYSSTVVEDHTSEYHGPLSGICAALPLCRHEWVLVVPCDMPYLPDDLTSRLASALDDKQIAVVQANDRMQLVFLMHHSLLPSIETSLDLGHYKTLQWLQSHKHVVVEFRDNHRTFANINSDAELSQLN